MSLQGRGCQFGVEEENMWGGDCLDIIWVQNPILWDTKNEHGEKPCKLVLYSFDYIMLPQFLIVVTLGANEAPSLNTIPMWVWAWKVIMFWSVIDALLNPYRWRTKKGF